MQNRKEGNSWAGVGGGDGGRNKPSPKLRFQT